MYPYQPLLQPSGKYCGMKYFRQAIRLVLTATQDSLIRILCKKKSTLNPYQELLITFCTCLQCDSINTEQMTLHLSD